MCGLKLKDVVGIETKADNRGHNCAKTYWLWQQEGHESNGGRRYEQSSVTGHGRKSVRLASADSKTSCGE